MQSYSLFELNEYIRRVFALNFQEAIWVRCEIAQINASRGHYYLNLIEKSETQETIVAQSSAIIWASTYRKLRREHKKTLDDLLQNGVAVLLKAKIDFDERYGLKLLIEAIDPSYTMGQMELKRQAILEALLKQGLLDVNHQIPLPPVIQRIAIISSESAAGLQDYLNHIAINAYGYQLHFESMIIECKNFIRNAANYQIQEENGQLSNLTLAKNALTQLEKVCQLLAPETALKRGFSITTANGKVVTKKSQVKKGDQLVTQLLKDTIKSTVD